MTFISFLANFWAIAVYNIFLQDSKAIGSTGWKVSRPHCSITVFNGSIAESSIKRSMMLFPFSSAKKSKWRGSLRIRSLPYWSPPSGSLSACHTHLQRMARKDLSKPSNCASKVSREFPGSLSSSRKCSNAFMFSLWREISAEPVEDTRNAKRDTIPNTHSSGTENAWPWGREETLNLCCLWRLNRALCIRLTEDVSCLSLQKASKEK